MRHKYTSNKRIPLWIWVIGLLILLPACALFGGQPATADPEPTQEEVAPAATDEQPAEQPTAVPDTGEEPAEPTGIAPGDSIVDVTQAVNTGDAAIFDTTFEVTAFQVASIEATLLDGVLDYNLELIDKFGNVLFHKEARAGENILTISEFAFPFDGQYRLVINALEGGGTLRAVVTALPIGTGGGTLDQVGLELNAIIQGNNVYHTYQFGLTEGQTVAISAAASTSGLPDTQLSLFGPDGRPAAAVDDAAPPDNLNAVLTNFSAPVSGTYIALVTHVEGTSGAYVFSVSEDTAAGEPEGEPDIVYNNDYRAEFKDADVLSLTFDATVGDVLKIEVFDLTPDVDVDIRVYSPFNQVLAYSVNDDDQTGETQVLNEMQIPETGRYRVELTPIGSGQASLHILRIATEELSGGGVFGDETSGIRTGVIEQTGVFHYYQFNASVGNSITVRVNSSSDQGELDLGFAILNPNGTQLTFADDSSSANNLDPAINDYELSQTGTYTIVVYSLTDATGSYELQYQRRQ